MKSVLRFLGILVLRVVAAAPERFGMSRCPSSP